MEQLKRQTAAHLSHLNDMMNVQQDELTRKFEGEREVLEANIRLNHLVELTKLLGHAQGIRDTVRNKTDTDRMSRQVRELWIAAHSLIDCLKSNDGALLPWEEQRRPLAQSLQLLSNSTDNNDEFTRCMIESIPADVVEGGVLPQGAIKVLIENHLFNNIFQTFKLLSNYYYVYAFSTLFLLCFSLI